MRDIATINAICLMIRHRQQVAEIPNQCESDADLIPAIRRFCEEGQAAFDEETERRLASRYIPPDWEALAEVVKVFCTSEKE